MLWLTVANTLLISLLFAINTLLPKWTATVLCIQHLCISMEIRVYFTCSYCIKAPLKVNSKLILQTIYHFFTTGWVMSRTTEKQRDWNFTDTLDSFWWILDFVILLYYIIGNMDCKNRLLAKWTATPKFSIVYLYSINKGCIRRLIYICPMIFLNSSISTILLSIG